jgi:hypothetical protein
MVWKPADCSVVVKALHPKITAAAVKGLRIIHCGGGSPPAPLPSQEERKKGVLGDTTIYYSTSTFCSYYQFVKKNVDARGPE